MRRLSAAIGRPVTFALNQNNNDPERVAAHARPRASAAADEGAQVRPAGARPDGVVVARLADVPSVQLLPDVGVDRTAAVARAGGADARRHRPSRSPRRRRRRRSTTIRSCRGSCIRRGSSCSATHPTTSRRRRAASRASPPPSGARTGRRLYDLLLADGGRELLNAPDPQLHRRQPRRGPRDAHASDVGIRARMTAARTQGRRATRARRRSCSATGRAIAPTIASRSRPRCTSSPARPRRCSVSATGACSRRG